MKTTLEKTKITRGRAVLLCLALAATLIVGMSAASGAAEAKLPVPALKKGVANLVKTTTALTGFVADAPVLRLQNDSAGGTALDLRVKEGDAPLTVNPEAGKATNLDADKLDGKDSAEFLTADGEVQNAANADRLDGKDSTEFLGAGAKAADSELLDGKDSAEFFSGKTYVVSESDGGSQQGNGETIVASASCDTGDRVLSGGGFLGGEEEDILEDTQVGEGPDFNANSTGWIIFVIDQGDPDPVTVRALCADFGEPHQD